jgi:hypothetical protein
MIQRTVNRLATDRLVVRESPPQRVVLELGGALTELLTRRAKVCGLSLDGYVQLVLQRLDGKAVQQRVTMLANQLATVAVGAPSARRIFLKEIDDDNEA